MNRYKQLIVMLADMAIVVIAFQLALMIKYDFHIVAEQHRLQLHELPIILLTFAVTFYISGMYRGLWRFASIQEVIRGTAANTFSMFIAYSINRFIGQNHIFMNIYLIALFLTTSGTIGMRLSYRVLRAYKLLYSKETGLIRTIIIGAGQAGVMLLEEMERNPQFDLNVVGFVDDDASLHGAEIRGKKVLGTSNDLEKLVEQFGVQQLIIAIPSLPMKETTQLLNKAEKTKAKVRLMPPFYEMVGDKKVVTKVRDVNIEDLLGRDPIKLEEDGIRDYVEGKTILVTGGGGSIGSELCRQIRKFNPASIVIVDIYENNAYELQMEFARMYRANLVKHQPEIIVLIASVRDKDRIDEIFEKHKPDVVFHAAAHKHVPLMEDSPVEAIKNNIIGTKNVADVADKHNVSKFVLISTDKAVRPTNVMGATKRIAELIVMDINKKSETDYSAVRFGNVLGSNGSVIPLFKKQIKEGGPVTVTHKDIKRYFMTIPEACQLVIQAGAFAKGGELFVLDMGEQVTITSLAEKLIRLSGYRPYVDIEIIFTGLRPGEKMYEELLIDESNLEKTKNDLILIQKQKDISIRKIYSTLDQDKFFELSKDIVELVSKFE